MRRLFRAAFRGRWPLAAAVALSLVTLSASQLSLTWVAKLWAEGVTRGDGPAAVARTAPIASLLVLATVAGVFVSRTLVARWSEDLVHQIRSRLARRVLDASFLQVRAERRGEVLSRLFGDADVLRMVPEVVMKRIVGEGLVLVGAVFMMFRLEPRLALATFLVLPPVALVAGGLGRRVRRRARTAREAVASLHAMAAEQLAGFSTIKGYGTEAQERDRFVLQSRRHRDEVVRSERWAAALIAGVWLLTGAWLLGVVWWGTGEVHRGAITSGSLLAFALYAVQTVEPLRRLGNVTGELQRAFSAADRVFAMIDGLVPEAGDGDAAPRPCTGRVSVRDVSFSWPSGERVLDGLSFDLAPGERIAIAAPSGAGKTSLARLLQRLVEPDCGRILLDGVDLSTLRLAEVRRIVTVVEQDPFVFAGTIEANVAYGGDGAPDEAVREAMRLAGLGAFLDGGRSSAVDEGGGNLSGGQRQRISLARAILRNPRVLILDEATSALDGETERSILEAIDGWLAERTVIVFSHRRATLEALPRILLLDDGTITEEGTFDELVSRKGVFRDTLGNQVVDEVPGGDTEAKRAS